MDAPELGLDYYEPATRAYNDWTPALLKQSELTADSGYLALAAELCETLMADDRVKAVLDTRTDALLGLPLSFEAALDGRKGKKPVTALEAGEDWWAAFPETSVKQLHAWGIVLGIGLARLVWREHDGRAVPTLSVKNPRHLRWDWKTRQWLLTVAKADGIGTEEIVVNPGDGTWLLYTPYGTNRPWSQGAWRALSRWCLLKRYAVQDWGFYSDRHGNGMLVVSGASENHEARKQLASDLRKIGRNAVIPLPKNLDMKLVEATAKTYETFVAQIETADNGAAVTLLGQNLTTQAGNASGTSATVHGRVALGRTKADAETLATCIHDQALTYWAAFNFGDSRAAPWPWWDTTPTADQKERASVVQMVAQGLGTLLANGVLRVADARRMLAEFGVYAEEVAEQLTSKAPIFAYHIQAGVVTLNEVRASLGLPPLPDGDRLTGQVSPAASSANEAA